MKKRVYSLEETRDLIESKSLFGEIFLHYFDSLKFDFVEVVKNNHPCEIFPALRGVKKINMEEKISYEIGFMENSLWFNIFYGRNHHNPKIWARFNKGGLKQFSRNHGFSQKHIEELAVFTKLVNDAYNNLHDDFLYL